ncbi:hypothetical protein BKA93DRAFT_826599 [Sparassis latifolia]
MSNRDISASKVAPIHCLSEDVLRLIFQTGWKWDSDILDEDLSRERMQFSICIASVCRAWRTIAHATSRLWSVIYFFPDRQRSLVALESFLCLSRRQKLSISISYRYGREDAAIPQDMSMEHVWVAAVMRLLVKHVDRWELLVMELEDIRTTETIFSIWTTPAVALKQLVLYAEPGVEHPESMSFPSAPELRSLELLIPLLSQTHNIASSFPALENLVLGTSFPDADFRFLRTLQPIQHLCHLALTGVLCDMLLQDPNLKFHFSALESLHLEATPIDHVYECLSVLEAPLLTTLRLDLENEHFITTHTGPFIRQPERFPLLHSIVFAGLEPNLGLSNVSQFLGSLKSAQVLFIGHRIEEFMKAASLCRPREGWCFVRLASLTISYDSGVPPQALHDLVEARRTASCAEHLPEQLRPLQIEEIQVNTSVELPTGDRRWFEANLRKFTWSKDQQQPCLNGWMEFTVLSP